MNDSLSNNSNVKYTHSHEYTELPKVLSNIIYDNNIELFNSMSEAFYNAEKYLKLVEIDTTLDIPSLNELRYVGFHMLKAMKSGISELEQAEELRRSKRHCERACYDAVEIGVLTLLEKVATFQDEFQCFNVTTHLDDYHSLLEECEKIREFVSTTSEDGKPEYYQKLFEHYKTARAIKLKLDRAEPSIASSFNQAKTKKAIATVTVICVLFMAGLGALNHVKSNEIESLKAEKIQLKTKIEELTSKASSSPAQTK